MSQREASQGRNLCVPVTGITFHYSAQGIVAVDLVEVVTSRIATRELHVHQPAQHTAAVYAKHMGLQQVIHRGRWDRVAVDGERLHDSLRGRIEAAERLPHEDRYDLLR